MEEVELDVISGVPPVSGTHLDAIPIDRVSWARTGTPPTGSSLSVAQE